LGKWKEEESNGIGSEFILGYYSPDLKVSPINVLVSDIRI
jgi:hypothetical protein